MKGTSLSFKLYVSLVISIGFITIYYGLISMKMESIPIFVFFVVLGIIAESVSIKINKTISASVSFGIGLASVLVFQSPVVAVIGFLSMILSIQYSNNKIIHLFNESLIKRLFNGSAYALSLTIAYHIHNAFKDTINLWFLDYNVVSISLSIIVYAGINILLYSILMAIIEHKTLGKLLVSNAWLFINVIAISPLGIFIAVIFRSSGMFAVILFFGPLLLARYSFKLYIDMKAMYAETIFALSNAIDAKDQYTNGHAHRVAEYAVGIARNMKFSESSIDKIRTAAILHDIGKIGINDTILNKPGKLEENEMIEIQKHPLIGSNILSQVHNLSAVATMIKYHHERYEGGGYPEGLSNNQVPIESYILAVADTFDAMTSDRPYRKAMERQVAVDMINQESGKQFYPLVVQAFNTYIMMQEEHGNNAN